MSAYRSASATSGDRAQSPEFKVISDVSFDAPQRGIPCVGQCPVWAADATDGLVIGPLIYERTSIDCFPSRQTQN